MAYCTQVDLVNRYKSNKVLQLTDDDKSGTIDSTIVTDAIAEADAIIDAMLNTRYPDQVPFTTTPAIIKRISIMLSGYYLYTRNHKATESVIAMHDDAIDLLTAIQDETMSIPEIDTTSRYNMNSTSDDSVEQNPDFRRQKYDTSGNSINTDATMDEW